MINDHRTEAPTGRSGEMSKLQFASDLAEHLAAQIMLRSTPDEIVDHPDIQRLWEVALVLEESGIYIPIGVETVLRQVRAVRAGEGPASFHLGSGR